MTDEDDSLDHVGARIGVDISHTSTSLKQDRTEGSNDPDPTRLDDREGGGRADLRNWHDLGRARAYVRGGSGQWLFGPPYQDVGVATKGGAYGIVNE